MDKTNQDKIWELAASKLHGEASEDEIKELNGLLKNPDNHVAYNSVNELNTKVKQTTPLYYSNATNSWSKVDQFIRKKQLKIIYKISQYAAIALLAFGIGILNNPEWPGKKEKSALYTEIQVPLGQMTEIILSDSSHVWLNSGTTLRYPNEFGEKSRQVELEGEAFFKVKPNDIPFKVKIKKNEVEVLGTSFAAIAYPDEDFSQITLVEGSVQINDTYGNTIRSLKPAQQLHIPDDPKENIKVRVVNTLFYESWINGQIKFEEERLAEVAKRMERWYNVEIKFTSEEARELRFTGTVLKNKPVDQSMQAISLLLPIRIKHQSNLNSKDLIIISKK